MWGRLLGIINMTCTIISLNLCKPFVKNYFHSLDKKKLKLKEANTLPQNESEEKREIHLGLSVESPYHASLL